MPDATVSATATEPAASRHERRNPTEVRFEDYAFVTAGIADGLELLELLERRAIDPRDWERGEEFWTDAILDDLSQGAVLSIELDVLQGEARNAWERRIPPLDEDLRAWIDFMRLLGNSDDPAARMQNTGLLPGDLGRLQRLWGERMQQEPKLVVELGAIVAGPPREVDIPRPGPTHFTEPSPHGIDGTSFFQALEDLDDILPFGSFSHCSRSTGRGSGLKRLGEESRWIKRCTRCSDKHAGIPHCVEDSVQEW